MNKNAKKTAGRHRRHQGIRKTLYGTQAKPRLSVFRSSKRIYAQVINDVEGRTLAAASSLELEKGAGLQAAAQVGKQVAEQAKAAGVSAVAFDRGGYRYHGRIKALADAAREAGLKF